MLDSHGVYVHYGTRLLRSPTPTPTPTPTPNPNPNPNLPLTLTLTLLTRPSASRRQGSASNPRRSRRG